MVAYNLIRSRRRTIAIEIHAHEVRVRAPTWTSRREIDAFVDSRTEWIAKHIAAQRDRVPPPVRTYRQGDELPYMGATLQIHHVEGRGQAYFNAEDRVLSVPLVPTRRHAVPLPPLGSNFELFAARPSDEGIAILPPEQSHIRAKIADWYKAQAQTLLTARSAERAAQMEVSFQSIRVGEFKRQWGSCAPGGVISYNWLLLMAPWHIADYIVVHELAHLRHANHGKRFWDLVETHYPSYNDARRWLRAHHEGLRL